MAEIHMQQKGSVHDGVRVSSSSHTSQEGTGSLFLPSRTALCTCFVRGETLDTRRLQSSTRTTRIGITLTCQQPCHAHTISCPPRIVHYCPLPLFRVNPDVTDGTTASTPAPLIPQPRMPELPSVWQYGAHPIGTT